MTIEEEPGFTCDNRLSFAGIKPAILVHALYHGTTAQGPFGKSNDRPKLSIADVEAVLSRSYSASPYDPDDKGCYSIDWLHGRPLKIILDLNTETFESRLYDRDAGEGRAAAIVATLNQQSIDDGGNHAYPVDTKA